MADPRATALGRATAGDRAAGARALGAVALVSLVVPLLVGCDGSDGGAGGGTEATGDAAGSPLDPYLAEIFGDIGPEDPNPWAVRAEELVAGCMAEAGFEYRPNDKAGMGSTTIPDEAGTVAFAEQYGYGYSIPFDGYETPLFWAEAPESEAVAWNRQYRTGLSAEARIAYDVALDGVYADPSSPDRPPEGEYDPALNGCRGVSYAEVYPDGMVGPADLSAVKDAVADVWLAVEEDPRVTETLAAWSTCMADAGYPGLTQIMDAENLLFSEIWPRWQDGWAVAAGSGLGVTDYDVVRRQVPDGLTELRTAEVELAVADAQCREGSGYLEAHRTVELELETQIVDMYRADLDAWVTWVREHTEGTE